MTRAAIGGLRGFHYLADGPFRRWVRYAIGVALAAYVVVAVLNPLLFGFQARPVAVITQGVTIAALSVALVLSFQGRPGAAALVALAAVWVELQSGIPFTGMRVSALVGLPVLVSAAGILLGNRAGYAVAGVTTATLTVLSTVASRTQPDAIPATSETVYLLVVTAAAMFASAALVQVGLESLGRALQAAHASERRLADLLIHAPDGVVATDAHGRIVSANPAAGHLLARYPHALVGASLAEVLESTMQPTGGDNPAEGILATAGDEAGVPSHSVDLRGPGGETWSVEARTSTVVWEDGSQGTQLMLRDVTERRRIEASRREMRERLEHAQRIEAVGRLAGGVAHEFNNVLTVVGGAAELLREESDGPGRDLAEDILEARTRGAVLTKQLLAFARKDMIQPRRINLAELAGHIDGLLAQFLTAKVHFAVDIDEDAPTVVADRAQMEQVVVNLVINAKDAIEGEGSVTLAVHPAGTRRSWNGRSWVVEEGFVEISVTDDGRGMDETVRSRAFEPFFSTKPRGQGTGLGLAMVHGTAVQHGGRVRILSEPGVGTAVLVLWPAVPEA